MLIFRYKKVATTLQKSLALRLCSDTLPTAMNTKALLLIPAIMIALSIAAFAQRPPRPGVVVTPPPPSNIGTTTSPR
jgi:hypothetical protein